MVNNERDLMREAEQALRDILGRQLELRVDTKQEHATGDHGHDLLIEAESGITTFRLAVQVKARVTPQTALSACYQMQCYSQGMIPVIYAPVISPRVAEILREQKVGYLDRAGNCWLRSLKDHLLIERQGFRTERQTTPGAADLFSPKSSRIIRALLSRPLEGWRVRQLADHPDVQVSAGLVVKVKRTLVEEGYATERKKELYLRDPLGLLKAWAKRYPGPVEQIPLYVRGDTTAAEKAISQGCRDQGLTFALAGFSAAWRLVPEVRYPTGAVYVEDKGFDPLVLDKLLANSGSKRVDTGPNLFLWRPFDRSVFTDVQEVGGKLTVTSALQTYLDLQRTAGRGEEAALAVFDKYLSHDLTEAAHRAKERQDGPV